MATIIQRFNVNTFPPEARFAYGQNVCYSDTRLPIGRVVEAFKMHDGEIAYKILQPSGTVTIMHEKHLMTGLPLGLAALMQGVA